MSRSHHAVAVELVTASEDTSTAPREHHLNKLRLAVNHHLCALKLVCEAQHIRAASCTPSLNIGEPTARFVGTGKNIMVANRVVSGEGKPTTIGVVSYDHTAIYA